MTKERLVPSPPQSLFCESSFGSANPIRNLVCFRVARLLE